MSYTKRFVSAIAVTVLSVGSVAADTVAIPPQIDNSIYQEDGGASNGAGDFLFIGRTQMGDLRRALLAFDIAGSLPAGSTITGVRLEMNVSRIRTSADRTVGLHRVTEEWGEGTSDAPGAEGEGTTATPGDATWTHRIIPDAQWMQPGGSFVPGSSADAEVGGLGPVAWASTPDLVADVQDWLDDPSSNFGWILVMASGDDQNGSAKRLSSRENPNSSDRPSLVVDYTPGIAAPSASFTWSPVSPSAGSSVSFTDTSTGNPDSWSWDFGDGAASTEQNPTHIYAGPGTYTVSLTASNAGGSDSVDREITVTDGGPSLDNFFFVPAAAKAAGAEGSFFLTDLDIQNGGSSTATYQLLWLPRNANNASPTASEVFTLGPGVAVRYRDVLGSVFGFDDGAAGALAVVSDSNGLFLMSRTYNLPPDDVGGSFGQSIPGLRSDGLIPPDERRRILFFTEDEEFRSNLGLLNGTGNPIVVRWERFTADGTSRGTGQRQLAPWSNTQINQVFSDFDPAEAAYVDVWTETAGGAFAAYGSVLDNATSDPTTVLPQ
jgi:PKD repeat protein